MTRDEVVWLREAVGSARKNGHYMNAVFLADHVAAQFPPSLYGPDGDELMADREWVRSIKAEPTLPDGVFRSDDFEVTIYSDKTGVWLSGYANGTLYLGNLSDFTRPRFLALLVGLGIEHKGYSDAP